MSSNPVPLPQTIGSYNDQLNLSKQNYQNVLNSFGQGQQNLSSALPGITQGYGALNQQVQSQLGLTGGGWGVAAPAAAAIGNTYANALGATDQTMINAGLGNSTVRANLRNQDAYQASQAYGSLGANLAQTGAGYTSQLGMAGLAARMQGLGLQTNLYGQQGSTLAGFHSPPIPNLYGQASFDGSGSSRGGFGGYSGLNGGLPMGGALGGSIANPGANSYGYSGGYSYGGGYQPGPAQTNQGQTLNFPTQESTWSGDLSDLGGFDYM